MNQDSQNVNSALQNSNDVQSNSIEDSFALNNSYDYQTLNDNSTPKNSSGFTNKFNKNKHNGSFSTSDSSEVGINNSKPFNKNIKKGIVINEQ